MKLTLLLGLLALFACSTTPKGKLYKLTILHTNDHHGRFWENREGELGLAARSTLIKELREEAKKEGAEILLLDAGDVNTGIPQSDLQDAEPDFKGMKALGYDVMALGNHEFDNDVPTIKRQREWAGFPFVSANIYDKKTHQRVFPSHITKSLGGLKVTVFGLTTEDTPLKSKAENTKGIYFVPSVEEAKKLVPTIRKESDVLIALTHIGHYPNENHGADAPGDVTLARKVNGIDLIVGGHTQKPLFEPDVQNGTIIVQAYEWGKYVGKVDLEIQDGKVKLKSYKLIPVNLKSSLTKIKPDPEIIKLLTPFKVKGDKSILKVVANADVEFIGRRDVIRFKETNLGNLISRANKDKFKADIGIMNAGGMRDSIYPGKVSIETLMTVLPFNGEIVTAEMTGKELTNYLEYVITKLNPGSGSFAHISGVEAVLTEKTQTISDLKVNGAPIDNSKKYLIALPEFIAAGGDKYPVLKYRKYGYVDVVVAEEYLLAHKNLRGKDYAPRGYIQKR